MSHAWAGPPCCVLVLLAASVAAQEQWDRGAAAAAAIAFRRAIRPPTSFDGGFNFCRLMYTSDRREAGGSGWSTDYLGRRHQFLDAPRRADQGDDQPAGHGRANHLVVRPDRSVAVPVPVPERHRRRHGDLQPTPMPRRCAPISTRAASCGWTISGATVRVGQLGEQHQQGAAAGGVPDRRPAAGASDVARAVRVQGLPQIPSISFWRRSGGDTSERGLESAVPDIKAINDRHGRHHGPDDAQHRHLGLVGAGGRGAAVLLQFSPKGYAVAINVVIYAMTH